jgi:hypothetical protein
MFAIETIKSQNLRLLKQPANNIAESPALARAHQRGINGTRTGAQVSAAD